MPRPWLTFQQAAELLSCSTRAIRQRVRSGGLETRITENGKRLVCPEPPELVPRGQSDDTRSGRRFIAGSIIELHKSQTVYLKAEVKRTRGFAIAGWVACGLLTVGLLGGTWWTTKSITASQMAFKSVQQHFDELETRTELEVQRASLLATEKARLKEDFLATEEAYKAVKAELWHLRKAVAKAHRPSLQVAG